MRKFLRYLFSLKLVVCFGFCGTSSSASLSSKRGLLGINTFNAALQFTGRASGQSGDGAGLNVTRSMGAKALADGHDAGFLFLRIGAAGYGPSQGSGRANDLDLWLNDPTSYWKRIDVMFRELRDNDLRLVPSFIWNPLQFPALTHETVSDLVLSHKSRSRNLAKRYIEEFIERYRREPTILFYELGNELDLQADLDQVTTCRTNSKARTIVTCDAVGNYTTKNLIDFSRDMVAWIKRFDPSSGVSSGFGGPRMDAAHLERHPQFSPGGPDWTADRRTDLTAYMLRVSAPFDIVSLHIYPDAHGTRAAEGITTEAGLAIFAASLFHPIGKKVFVGEFGTTGPTGLIRDLAKLVRDGTIDYASLWSWEFYQFSTHPIFGPSVKDYRVEPGHGENIMVALTPALAKPALKSAKARVVLTWPLPCANVVTPIELYAVASVGAETPQMVEFFVGGQAAGVATSVPFTSYFDPRQLGSRLVTIEARVSAPNGASASFKSDVLLNGSKVSCKVPE